MTQESFEYWLERTLRQSEIADLEERKAIRKIQRMEAKCFKDIEKEIMILFQRYAEQQNLSIEEAQMYLTSREYIDFRADVGTYIEAINNEDLDEVVREQLKMEYNTLAMKTRISRLEELSYHVNRHLDTLFFYSIDIVRDLLEESVTASYNEANMILRRHSKVDKKMFKILEKPWSGANFSENIWDNRNKLAGIAKHEITRGLYRGNGSKQIARAIKERMDANMKDIERVVRTESRFVRNEASAQAYEEYGYTKYKFSSHTEGRHSDRTCSECKRLNKEVYKFSERMPGINYPPMHPNCRCTIIPVIDNYKRPSDD